MTLNSSFTPLSATSKPPHAYNRLLSCCSRNIFEYFTQEVHQDVDLYSEKDLEFFARYIRCWDFKGSLNVKAFLERTRGKKRTLYYVSSTENQTIDSETFKYFRGIHELDIQLDWEEWEAEEFEYGDEDFANLRGIHTLNMSGCRFISDAAFEHLRGIHTLDMSACDNITDAALENLRGIHTLSMSECYGITDQGLENLRGVHTLDISSCKVSDAGLVHLRGIHTLKARRCSGITDAGLENLRDIHTLYIDEYRNFTDAGFVNLRGINTLILDTDGCQITEYGLENVRGLKEILIHSNGSGLRNLRSIETVHFYGGGDSIKTEELKNLRGVKTLKLSCCKLTGEGFENLSNLEMLTLYHCPEFSGEALLHLHALKHLTLCYLKQDSIRDEHFVNLKQLEVLEVHRSTECPLSGITASMFSQFKQLKRLSVFGDGWIVDDSFLSNIAEGIEDVHLPSGRISCANLHVMRGTKKITLSQLSVGMEDLDHAKDCLRDARFVVGQLVGSGAEELRKYLQDRETVRG